APRPVRHQASHVRSAASQVRREGSAGLAGPPSAPSLSLRAGSSAAVTRERYRGRRSPRRRPANARALATGFQAPTSNSFRRRHTGVGALSGANTEGDEMRGAGSALFAGILMMVIGVIDLFYGIAAVANSKFYVGEYHYVFSGQHTWGWITIFVGVILI